MLRRLYLASIGAIGRSDNNDPNQPTGRSGCEPQKNSVIHLRVTSVMEYLAARHSAEPEDQRRHWSLHISGQLEDDSHNCVR